MTHPAFERWRDLATSAPELSVVVPVQDEAHRIVPLLRALAVVVARHGYAWELIVADEGSSDGTAETLRALPWANLRVVSVAASGRGAAIRAGVLEACGDRVLWVDAQDATPAGALFKLMLEIDAGHDVAVGSSGHEPPTDRREGWRYALAGRLRSAAGRLVGVRAGDGPGGVVLMRRRAARVLARGLRTDGDGFELELRLLARESGLRVAEVRVHGAARPFRGAGALRGAVQLLRDAARVRLRSRRPADRGARPDGPSGASATPIPPTLE